MKNLLIAVVVLVLLAGAYVERHTLKTMLMGSGSSATPTQGTSATPEAMSGASGATNEATGTSGAMMQGKTQKFTLKGTEFAFAPSTMTVAKGDTVEVTFTNDGKYPHNFTITELNVKSKTIQPGESDTVTFTADKAGTFQYFCSVPTHKDRGMVGTLTVQ